MILKERIQTRIKELIEFKMKAAGSCNKPSHSTNGLEVDTTLFSQYGLDKSRMVSDQYFVMKKIVEVQGSD